LVGLAYSFTSSLAFDISHTAVFAGTAFSLAGSTDGG
jgi:hypothetical protein